MSSAITNAGEALIALKQNQEAGLVIDKFILANVDGVDPAVAVDRTEGMPDAGDIVYEYTIPAEGKGYINPNQVVFSMLLTSDIGDFDFNWVGLYSSADDTVIAITYLPTLSKWATAHPTMGNAITRNFMLEYSGIQDVTAITVEASTWQIDFTARLKGIDERERLSNMDIYGGACFFGDAYLVVNDGGTFKVQPGTAYVEGVRISLDLEQTIAPDLPAEVFLDVALQPQGSDRVAVASIVYADPGDYQDGVNDNHYGQKIAEIAADGTVTDLRAKTLGGELSGLVAGKTHIHYAEDIIDLDETDDYRFSAAHFGAKGDGVTDDTEAIQAAINAAEAAGRGCVWLPDGTYLISAPLRISANYVGLRGAGLGATRILATTDITAVIIQRPNPITQWGYRAFVQDLTVECSAGNPTSGIGILVDAYGHSLVSNVYIDGFWRGLVLLGNPSTVIVASVDITQGANNTALQSDSACCVVDRREIVSTNPNAVLDAADGLYYHEPNSIFFQGCNFRPSGLGAEDTLLVRACDGLYASGSYFGGGEYQTVRFSPAQANLNIGGVVVSGCRIDPKAGVTEYGILYDTNADLTSEYTGGHQFVGCTVGGAAITAVWIEGVVSSKPQDIQFTGCKIKNTDDNGVVIASGDNIVFSGCSFEDSNTSSGTFADVNLAGGSNLMFNGCAFKGNSYRGIRSAGTDAVYRVSIIGCRFQDATADNCIYLAHTTKNDTVANNDCESSRSVASTGDIVLPAVFDTFIVTGTTTINNIASVATLSNRRCEWEGRRVSLLFSGSLTVSTSGNINLKSTYSATPGSVLSLIFINDGWYEVSRT